MAIEIVVMPTEVESVDGQAVTHSPSSEFILQRIIKNDMQGLPGWQLNPEMRQEFVKMLQERKDGRQRGR